MPDCGATYLADVAECDRLYTEAKALCDGNPECLKAAIAQRQDCEDEAYLKYLICISGSPAPQPPPDSGGCGCAGSSP